MSATFPSRPGQINLAGSVTAIFLKVFSGEVISTYEELNVMMKVVQSRTISFGKSAQFPVLGRAAAFYHTPGVNIMDSANPMLSLIPSAERIINIDNMLTSSVVISDIDEAMTHFDVRGPYARELGRAIAKRVDQLALHTMILAARSAATITGLNGGSVIVDATAKTSGVTLQADLLLAAQRLDEKDVPGNDRWAVISPQMYYNLIRDPTVSMVPAAGPFVGIASSGFPLLDRDLSAGNGDFAKAALYVCAGFGLLVSNHIPSTNILVGDAFFGTGAASSNGNVYYGDFTSTAGVAFHRSAIGMVNLVGLTTGVAYKLEFLGWLTVTRLAMGIGILRPECSVEIAIA